MSRRRVLCVALVAVTHISALAACGGSDKSSSPEDGVTVAGKTVRPDPAVQAKLPRSYKSKGVLSAQTDASNLPQAVVDENGKITGLLPDLLKAAAAKLGLRMTLRHASFDAQVPGVQSGRFDFTTTTGDFKEREKVLDMVDYIKAGTALYVPKGNPKHVGTINDLCGLRVAVTRGGLEDTTATDQSKKCAGVGRPPVNVLRIAQAQLDLPLASGRVDVAYDDAIAAQYIVAKNSDRFEMAGKPLILAPLAFGFRKDNTALRDAMQAALQSLIDDGTYQAIFDKWQQGPFALEKITINATKF